MDRCPNFCQFFPIGSLRLAATTHKGNLKGQISLSIWALIATCEPVCGVTWRLTFSLKIWKNLISLSLHRHHLCTSWAHQKLDKAFFSLLPMAMVVSQIFSFKIEHLLQFSILSDRPYPTSMLYYLSFVRDKYQRQKAKTLLCCSSIWPLSFVCLFQFSLCTSE